MPVSPGYHREERPDSTRPPRPYTSPRWRAFRAAFLRRNPICSCGQVATQVDHIRRLGPGVYMYDQSNLQALCASCHSRKTALHDGAFGRATSD
jgi:5-methylcytosine-specific restriction enzyme A